MHVHLSHIELWTNVLYCFVFRRRNICQVAIELGRWRCDNHERNHFRALESSRPLTLVVTETQLALEMS